MYSMSLATPIILQNRRNIQKLPWYGGAGCQQMLGVRQVLGLQRLEVWE